MHGEIDRATFTRQYGHHSPHLFELSYPRPAEDPQWIDQQLAGLRAAPTDIMTLLARQKEAQEAAWDRFQRRYPRLVTNAIVTDVGAPLSHASIVARELGIPAVVGCGNATMRLHTGDWLRVNGELGTVEILRVAHAVQPLA
jgi:hypothetical protein